MLKKLSQILIKLTNSKLKYFLPKKIDLLIFDESSVEDLKYIVKNRKYFILQTRFESVSILYINFFLFFKTILKYRGNLWSAYLISIIEYLKPKVVLSFIDNSFKFHDLLTHHYTNHLSKTRLERHLLWENQKKQC